MSKQKNSVKVLSWEGSLSIEKAVSLRQELLDSMAHCTVLQLDLSSVKTVDLSIIQILLAARKEADLQGKTFHLSGILQEGVMRQIKLAGFIDRDYQNAKDIEPVLFSVTAEREL